MKLQKPHDRRERQPTLDALARKLGDPDITALIGG
jgi:hypothetical protein